MLMRLKNPAVSFRAELHEPSTKPGGTALSATFTHHPNTMKFNRISTRWRGLLAGAVLLPATSLAQVAPTGGVDEQALQLRDAMRVLFPEAVALVSAARQGFMRE